MLLDLLPLFDATAPVGGNLVKPRLHQGKSSRPDPIRGYGLLAWRLTITGRSRTSGGTVVAAAYTTTSRLHGTSQVAVGIAGFGRLTAAGTVPRPSVTGRGRLIEDEDELLLLDLLLGER